LAQLPGGDENLVSVAVADIIALVASSPVVSAAQARLLRLVFRVGLQRAPKPRSNDALRARVQQCWGIVAARILATQRAAAEALKALCATDKHDAFSVPQSTDNRATLSVDELAEYYAEFALAAAQD
jgi:hypothetical protein